MLRQGQLIDFQKYQKKNHKKKRPEERNDKLESFSTTLIDFQNTKVKKLKKEQRKVKRTVLNGLVGVTVMVPDRGLMRVQVQDISKSGLSFDMYESEGAFFKGEQLELRIYVDNKIYFPFVASVENTKVRFSYGAKVIRHGLKFKKSKANRKALDYFVGFLEAVVKNCKEDSGDRLISHLKS